MLGMPALARSATKGQTSDTSAYEATQVMGLPDAKPSIKGQLTLSNTELQFANQDFTGQIPFIRITSVSVGNQRVETGGKTGSIARKVIPYGGGMALATITQKSVDLFTIEYVDPKGGYHGAVFFMPKASAQVLSDRMASRLSTVAPRQAESCAEGSSNPSAVVLEPIASGAVSLPAEYRVLLYEGLFNELRDSAPAAAYVRAGSADASCSGMKLKITVTDFKKGNQVLRAETGPIGLFVGKTSVSFHVELTAADGHRVLAEDMTSSKRMDSDSLGVAKSVAKAVSKKIRKLPAAKSASQAAGSVKPCEGSHQTPTPDTSSSS